MFEKRFKESDLKEMKKSEVPYKDSVAQYDKWFENWKATLAKKQKSNGQKVLLRSNADVDSTDLDPKANNKNHQGNNKRNQHIEQENCRQDSNVINDDKDESGTKCDNNTTDCTNDFGSIQIRAVDNKDAEQDSNQ